MKKYIPFLLCVLFVGAGGTSTSVPPDEALKRLVDGNGRFTAWKAKHPHQDEKRLAELSSGQSPFASILTCADSRVPPEVIFDQGLGDLFVVRMAGNVATPEALGSLEYSVEHLGSKLIVVLGHESCGAVDATLTGKKLPGHIETIAQEIRPALKGVSCPVDDKLNCSIKANVDHIVKEIESSKPILAELVKNHDIRVVGGYYSLKTGQVSVEGGTAGR